jgi:hypothetical protein
MYGWIRDFGFYGSRDAMAGHRFFKLRGFKTFVKETGWKGEEMKENLTLKQASDRQYIH